MKDDIKVTLSIPEVEHILGHLLHEGPVLLAGDAGALEPVLLLQPAGKRKSSSFGETSFPSSPLLSVVLGRVEEDRAVVLTNLLTPRIKFNISHDS